MFNGNVPSNFFGHCAEKNFRVQFLGISVKIWALKILLLIEISKRRTSTFVHVQAEWSDNFLLIGYV